MVARRVIGLLLAGALAGGFAACGGEDDGGAEVGLEDTAAGGASTGDATGEGGDGGEGGESVGGPFGAGCADVSEAMATLSAAIAGSFSGGTDEAVAGLEAAVEQAPPEVRDAFEIYGTAVQEYLGALEERGIDLGDPDALSDPEAAAAFAEAAAPLSEPEVTAAQQEITTFIGSGCEV